MTKHDKLAAIKRNLLRNKAIQFGEVVEKSEAKSIERAIDLDPTTTTRVVNAWLAEFGAVWNTFNFCRYYLMAKKLGINMLDDHMLMDQGAIVDDVSVKIFSWTNAGARAHRTIKSFEDTHLGSLTKKELEQLFYTCVYHLPIDFSDKDAWQPLLDTVEATVERVFKRFHPDIPAVENNGSEDATAVFTRHIYGAPEEDMGTPYSIWDDIKSMFSWSKK